MIISNPYFMILEVKFIYLFCRFLFLFLLQESMLENGNYNMK